MTATVSPWAGEGATMGGRTRCRGRGADNAQALGGKMAGEALGGSALRGGIAAANHG